MNASLAACSHPRSLTDEFLPSDIYMSAAMLDERSLTMPHGRLYACTTTGPDLHRASGSQGAGAVHVSQGSTTDEVRSEGAGEFTDLDTLSDDDYGFRWLDSDDECTPSSEGWFVVSADGEPTEEVDHSSGADSEGYTELLDCQSGARLSIGARSAQRARRGISGHATASQRFVSSKETWKRMVHTGTELQLQFRSMSMT